MHDMRHTDTDALVYLCVLTRETQFGTQVKSEGQVRQSLFTVEGGAVRTINFFQEH